MKTCLFVTWPFLNGQHVTGPHFSLRSALDDAVNQYAFDSPDIDEIQVENHRAELVIPQDRLVEVIKRGVKRKGVRVVNFCMTPVY